MKTLHDDELLDIVSAANIAGHMEHAGAIVLPDDEELLNFIIKQMPFYESAVHTALDENPDDGGLFNWYDWIDSALRQEYGTEGKNNEPDV